MAYPLYGLNSDIIPFYYRTYKYWKIFLTTLKYKKIFVAYFKLLQRVPDFFVQSDGTHELGPIQMNEEEESPVEEPPQVCLF